MRKPDDLSNIAQVLERIEERLKTARLSAAAASTRAGLSIDAIRNIRRRVAGGGDRGTVNLATLVALARVLGTTPTYLATGGAGGQRATHRC